MEKAIRLFLAFCILVFTQTTYKYIQTIGIPSDINLLSWLDSAIPWIYSSIWIYASIYITLVGAGWILEKEAFILTFKRVVFAQLFSFIFFWQMSIYYPRPCPRVVTSELLRWGYMLMGDIDRPNNTFPSMHVSLTCIVMHQLWKQGVPRWLCVSYAALVCISTLTTKQHFIADVAGGYVVYRISLLVCKEKPAVVQ